VGEIGQSFGVAFDDVGQTAGVVEVVVVLFDVLGGIDEAQVEERGFDVIETAQAPLGHGHLADECFFSGSGGMVLGFERVEERFEVGLTFSGEDGGAGGKSVFDAVQSDGGAAFRRFWAGAFLRVLFIGC